jgi:hypothetical protein
MSDTEKTVRATVKSDFNDAGSDRKFATGETHDLTAGEYENYLAADLVEAATDKAEPSTTPKPTKAKRPRAPRAAKTAN